jgi:hypothetical protein
MEFIDRIYNTADYETSGGYKFRFKVIGYEVDNFVKVEIFSGGKMSYYAHKDDTLFNAEEWQNLSLADAIAKDELVEYEISNVIQDIVLGHDEPIGIIKKYLSN